MESLKIAHYPEKILLAVAKPVTEFDADLRRLVENMFETMYVAGGVGLAAPQVFESKRLFVMDCARNEEDPRKFALINPEIIHVEGEQLGEEGCLSFPGLFQNVKRQLRAVVRYQNLIGDFQEIEVENLEARCVLHETDHCDGIVFLDRMTPLKRQMAKQKIKRLQKTGEWD